MEKKKDGFDGQKAIILPRKVLRRFCEHPLISDLYLTDIGHYPKARHHYRERVVGTEQHILIYCMEGRGLVQIADKELSIEPGNFFIIPSGTPHKYQADQQSPWTIYWAHFGGQAATVLVNEFVAQNPDFKQSVQFEQNRGHLFDDILSNLEMGYSYDSLVYICGCFRYFLTSFLYHQFFNYYQKSQTKDLIERSIDYMKENIDQLLTLEMLAGVVHLSISHYSMLFRNKTGYAPIEHFNHLKIQKACQYLLFTDLRIKEIAAKLGMDDPYYFSRMFSKIMGVAPATYRIHRNS